MEVPDGLLGFWPDFVLEGERADNVTVGDDSENNDLELAGALEGDPVLDEEAVPCPERRRDGDHERDGESERAGQTSNTNPGTKAPIP